MNHPNPSTAMASVIVDELARHGIRRAVIAPGSRSTALVVALLNLGADIEVNIDERSAGFRALGHAVGGAVTGLVVTTSGSAVANLLPAVVEAERSAVPMILLTADRPPAMVARRTNQTMDQQSVFAGYLRHRVDLGPAVDAPASNPGWRQAVSAAVEAATGTAIAPPGPVQINVAFEEPTVPVSDDGRVSASEFGSDTGGRPGGAPWSHPSHTPRPAALPVEIGRRAVVVTGKGDYDVDALMDVAARSGIPVLATALSGGRGGGALTAYHHLLADGVPARLAPDTVIVVGACGPSDRLIHLMSSGTRVIHVDRWGRFTDVSGTMTDSVTDDPATFLASVVTDQEDGWESAWKSSDSAVREAVDTALDGVGGPSGPGVARAVSAMPWDALVVASSLPIRDVDAHVTSAGWIHSNRGLSGIDGFVSTALGVADLRPATLALSGDLSLLHDGNGFLADRRPPLVMVVVDNGGGGLFDLLPQAKHAPEYERVFVTPPGRDLATFASFHGLHFVETGSVDELAEVIPSLLADGAVTLVRIAVDRSFDLEVRRRLDEVGAAASAG